VKCVGPDVLMAQTSPAADRRACHAAKTGENASTIA
jgi:hypothetical protein